MTNQINIAHLHLFQILGFPRQYRILPSGLCCIFFRFILVSVYNHYHRKKKCFSRGDIYKFSLLSCFVLSYRQYFFTTFCCTFSLKLNKVFKVNNRQMIDCNFLKFLSVGDFQNEVARRAQSDNFQFGKIELYNKNNRKVQFSASNK